MKYLDSLSCLFQPKFQAKICLQWSYEMRKCRSYGTWNSEKKSGRQKNRSCLNPWNSYCKVSCGKWRSSVENARRCRRSWTRSERPCSCPEKSTKSPFRHLPLFFLLAFSSLWVLLHFFPFGLFIFCYHHSSSGNIIKKFIRAFTDFGIFHNFLVKIFLLIQILGFLMHLVVP